MKYEDMHSYRILALSFFIVCLFTHRLFAQTNTEEIKFDLNYQGYLQSDAGKPFSDKDVQFTLSLYDQTGTCLLYQEQYQHIDMAKQGGYFSFAVGSLLNSEKRTAIDPKVPFTKLFGNQNLTLPISEHCPNGYSAKPNQILLLRFELKSETLQPTVFTPDQIINTQPYALDAHLLQNFNPNQFLASNANAGLTQSNLSSVFSQEKYPVLIDLLAGTSPLYMPSNTFSGITLPSLSGAASTAKEGDIWFNPNRQALEFNNGTQQTIALGKAVNPGTVLSIQPGNGLSGSAIQQQGTLALATLPSSGGPYPINSSLIPQIQVDNLGRLLNPVVGHAPILSVQSQVNPSTYGFKGDNDTPYKIPVFTLNAQGFVTAVEQADININQVNIGQTKDALPDTLVSRDESGYSAFRQVRLQSNTQYFSGSLAPSSSLAENYTIIFPANGAYSGDSFIINNQTNPSGSNKINSFRGDNIAQTIQASLPSIMDNSNQNNPKVSLPAASATQNGYLSAANYAQFQNKVTPKTYVDNYFYSPSTLAQNNHFLLLTSANNEAALYPYCEVHYGSYTQLNCEQQSSSMQAEGSSALMSWHSVNNNALLYQLPNNGVTLNNNHLIKLLEVQTNIDTQTNAVVSKLGSSMSGNMNMRFYPIHQIPQPTSNTMLANRAYVDKMGQTAGGGLTQSYPNAQIAQLRQTPINILNPTNKSFIAFNGSQYYNKHLDLNDITNQTNTQVIPKNCNSGQTWRYNTTNNVYECQNLQVNFAEATLKVTQGGTGSTTLSANQLLMNQNNQIVALPAGTDGDLLQISSNGLPEFKPLALNSVALQGIILLTPYGGTGKNTHEPNQLLYSYSNQWQSLNAGAAALACLSTGESMTPAFGSVDLKNPNATTGLLPVTRGGFSNPQNTNYALLVGNGNNATLTVLPTLGNHNFFLKSQGPTTKPDYARIDLSANQSFSAHGVLSVAQGGLGRNAWSSHQLLIGKAATPVAQITFTPVGYPLISQGASAEPAFSRIDLSTNNSIEGILPDDFGGTGLATINANRLIYKNDMDTWATLDAGNNGELLLYQGPDNLPIWGSLDLSNGNLLANALPAVHGGTGASALTSNALMYINQNQLTPLAAGTAGRILQSQGSNQVPQFTALNLSLPIFTNASLPVSRGGLGISNSTTNQLLLGQGAAPVAPLSSGTAGMILRSGALAADAPSFQSLPLNDSTLVQGILGVAHGGLGDTTAFNPNQLLLGQGAATPKLLPNSANTNDLLISNGDDLAPAFSAISLSDPSTISGTLSVPTGGFGLTEFTVNRLLVGREQQPVALLGPQQANMLLGVQATDADPGFRSFHFNSMTLAGQLPPEKGGLGNVALSAKAILLGGGAGPLNVIAPNVLYANQALIAQSGVAPSFQPLDLTNAPLANTLSVAQGGTGVNSSTALAHRILVGQNTAALSGIAPGNTQAPLVSQGNGAAPVFQAVPLHQTSYTSATLPVGNGGLGANPTTLAANQILVGKGSAATVTLNPNQANTVLVGNAADAPAFKTLNLTDMSYTGLLPVARGGLGASIANPQLLVGQDASPVSLVEPLTAGRAMVSNGPSNAPSFQNLNLSTAVYTAGQPLPVAAGGTGSASFSDQGVLVGEGTGALTTLPKNQPAQPLVNLGSFKPNFQSLDLSNSNAVTGILPVERGGTGSNNFTDNQLLVGQASQAITSIATGGGLSKQIMAASALGIAHAPSFQTLNLGNATTFSNKLSMSYGGTNVQTLSANTLLMSQNNQFTSIGAGTAGAALISNGTTAVPSFKNLNLANTAALTGHLPATHGGLGSAASTPHALMVGQGTANPAALTESSANVPLLSRGSTGAPVFGPLHLGYSNTVSGTLPLEKGGTGLVTILNNHLLVGMSSGYFLYVNNVSQANIPLVSVGTNAIPQFTQISMSTGVSGILPILNGGTGSNSKQQSFDNLSPLTQTGDILGYQGGNNVAIARHTAASTALLVQQGTGSESNAASWSSAPGFDGRNITPLIADNIGSGSGEIALSSSSVDAEIRLTPGSSGSVIVQSGSMNVNGRRLMAPLMRQNVSTTNYSPTADDTGRMIRINSNTGSPITITLPANLPKGFYLFYVQQGTDPIIFQKDAAAPNSFVKNSKNYYKSAGQNSIVSMFIKQNSDNNSAYWVLSGELTSP